MENIKRATAIYSGGGIYLYYGELEDGNWLMGDDGNECFVIVNTSPLANDETFEESGYLEWQEEHLVEWIHRRKFKEVLKSLVDVISKGKTIEECDNFLLSELKRRVEN